MFFIAKMRRMQGRYREYSVSVHAYLLPFEKAPVEVLA